MVYKLGNDTVLEYIFDHPRLGKLVSEFEVEEKEKGENYPTEDIFNLLASEKIKLNVTSDELRELYNILHFQRMDAESEEKAFNSKFDNEVLSKRNEELTESQIEIEKRVLELESKKREIATPHVIEYDDSKLTEQLKTLKASLDDTNEKFNSRLDNIKKELSFAINSSDNNKGILKKVKNLEDKLEKRIKDSSDQGLSTLKKSLKNLKKEIDENLGTMESRFNDSLTDINEKIDALFKAKQKDLMGANIEVEGWSPLDAKRQDIKQEAILIHCWAKLLSDRYNVHLTVDQATLIHCVFKSLSYISLTDISICKSWIETLGYEESVKIDTASPLWVSQLDWYGLYSHLSLNSSEYRFGVLSDFDIAITESYLRPTLEKWALTGRYRRKKLFLIQSTNLDDKLPQNDLLGLIGIFNYENFPDVTLNQDLSGKDKFPIEKALPRVKESSLISWNNETEGNKLKRFVVDIPKERDGIDISYFQLSSFATLLGNLEEYFNRVTAVNISYEIILAKYVEVNYGLDASHGLKNFITEVLEYE